MNRDVGRRIASFSTPGRLVTQTTTPDVDTMWAEVNFELLLPWIEHGDMPFDQIHGHAAPFRWNAGDWWPETPEVVKQHTVANVGIRRSVTTLASGRTLTGVDWVMEHTCPARLWPLLSLNGDRTAGMLGDAPELWRGPGVLFSVSATGSEGAFARIAGPRSRIAAWEQRWEAAPQSFLPSVDVRDDGDADLLAAFRAADDVSGWSFELDVSWNDDSERQAAFEAMGELLPSRLFRLVASLPELDALSINENRQVPLGEEFGDLGVRVLDMPINSLPSTRRRTRDLVLGVRWVRLILLQHGLIALWHPVSDGNWVGSKVPWPHNAVPSRAKDALKQLRSSHIEPADRQAMWLADAMTHERYFNASWVSELEQWQDDAFQWLTNSLTLGDVTSLREDLGLLSRYLTAARWTQRALVRRVQETRLDEVYPRCAEALRDTAEKMAAEMPSMRRNLAESFDILSTISQRVQEEAANEANAASERLNWLITLFTAVLFVPTVVSGIYGANIEVLADGAKGSFWELIALMVGLALLSFGLLNIVSKKWGESILGISCGVSMVAIYEIPARVFHSSINIIWATLPMVVFLIGIGLVNTVSRRRT